MQQLRKQEIEQRRILETLRDPNAGKSDEELIKERVAHVADLQFNKGDQIFAVGYSTIHKAACDGNCSAIKWFITSTKNRAAGLKKANVDDMDQVGMCPIHYAAERGHDMVIRLLVEKGCPVDLRSRDMMTGIMFAAKGGFGHTLQCLHELGAELELQNRAGMMAAHFAAQGNHVEALETLYKLSLINRERAIDAAKYMEAKLFSEDASLASSDKRLLSGKGGADPRATAAGASDSDGDGDGDDDDHDDDEAVDEDINSMGGSITGRSIVNSKSKKRNKKNKNKKRDATVEEIERVPLFAIFDIASLNGSRPLHLAATSNCIEAATYLVSRGVPVDAQDNNGDTALHRAARRSHFGMYQVLVELGADEDKLNHLRESPASLLHDAVRY